jgi:hypothetical protein
MATVMFAMDKVQRTITTIGDTQMNQLKRRWFEDNHRVVPWKDYLPKAQEWFLSSKLVTLHGVDKFPYVDVTCGNTQFIESFVLKHGWDGFQILNSEYAYYGLMGKHGVSLDWLESNRPMIVTIPDFMTGDVRWEWEHLLKIAEEKNIDLHLDLAWIVMSRDIEINLDHPCIKSFGISMSKLHLNWNRAGLRWSKQRTMDGITILNHYYKTDINTNTFTCADYHMENIDRDYAWNTYGDLNTNICNELNLEQTKFVHCVKKPEDKTGLYCITPLLLEHA